MPQILKVDSTASDTNVLIKTCNVLQGGGVIAFPTDTFYGLGVDPCNKKAVDKIYEIKNRDPQKPLLLLIDSVAKLDSLVEEPSQACMQLIDYFWPGPLTLLFKPKKSAPEFGTAELVAIRQPGNRVTRNILSSINHPLTAPSANISGSAAPTSAQQVKEGLGDKVDLILDGGTCPGGAPSTLVDATQIPIQCIREGAISFQDIQNSLTARTK